MGVLGPRDENVPVFPETTRLLTKPGASGPAEVTPDSIARFIGSLRFRRSLWGADDRDVMVQVHRLDKMYRTLLREQEDKYEALLNERDRQVRTLQRRLDRV